MSNPMKQLGADLIDKKLNYNNNPVLKWCLCNTNVKRDDNDNIRPVKRSKTTCKNSWSSKFETPIPLGGMGVLVLCSRFGLNSHNSNQKAVDELIDLTFRQRVPAGVLTDDQVDT